jgi:gluconolactonase
VFAPDAESMRRWRGWWRIVRADQWGVFFIGSLLGMALPALLYVTFLPHGTEIRGLGISATLAQGVGTQLGPFVAIAIAILGAWLLFKTQLDTVDAITRSVTDILWTGSRRLRSWRGGDVRAVYYSVLALVVLWGVIALRLAQPIVLLQIGANVAGVVLTVASIHLLYINCRLLAPELRPPMWRRLVLVCMSIFYGCFAALSLWSLSGGVAHAEKVATLGRIERLDPAFDRLVAPDAVIELLAANRFEWAEGPVWDRSGQRLLFSDIPRNMIWEWSQTSGLKEFLEPSGYTARSPFTGHEPGSNGLAFNAGGELVMCQHGDRRIAKWVDGKFVTLADRYAGKRLNSPNDLVIRSNGDVYFTDPPYGLPRLTEDLGRELDFQGVYRLDAQGKVALLTKELTRPNGLAFSPDEKTLYVANSDPERAVLMAFPVSADGSLGPGTVFFDATADVSKQKPGLPDGLKVSRDGTVWASGPGGVRIYSPQGKHLGTLATGVATANLAFGDDGSTLYLTADKNLARVRTQVKGW